MLGLFVSLLVSTGAPATAPAPAPATALPADPPAPATVQPAPARHGKRVPPPDVPAQPSPLRRLMQAQLDMPAREDGTGGISAPEADAVMAHYLASIGKPLDPAPRDQETHP